MVNVIGPAPRSPEEIKRMRAIAAALAQGRSPKNIGEGLSEIGNAIAYRMMMGDISKAESAGAASAADAMGPIMSGFGGAPTPPPESITLPKSQNPIPPEMFNPNTMDQGSGELSGGLLPAQQSQPAPQKMSFDPNDRSVPASIRTNNPGAQWMGPTAKKYGATDAVSLSGGNNAAVFPDPTSGAAAQFALWNRGYTNMPLAKAVQKWSGGNSSPAYLDFLTKRTGLTPDAVITPELLQGPTGIELAKAQAQWEAGRPYPMEDQQWAEAQKRGLGVAGQQVASNDPNFMPMSPAPIGGSPLAPPSQPEVAMAFNGEPAPATPIPPPVPPSGMQPFTSPQNLQMMRTAPTQLDRPPQQSAPAAPAAPAGPSLTVQQLMKAAQNPWLSAGQQAIVKTLLAQELQKQDPAHQVDLQLKKAQLNKLTNPGTPDAVRALQERASLAGLQPGTPAYNQFMTSGGGSRQTIAPPEKGMRYVYDQNGNVVSEEPIPGGSVDRANKSKDAFAKQGQDIVLDDIRRSIPMADAWTTGIGGATFQTIPGTSAYNLHQMLQGIKANVGFDRLQQMRNSSPTGGALGQVSEQENRLLQSTMGSLEQSQDKGQFLYNLKRLHNVMVDTANGTPDQIGQMLKSGKITQEQHDAALAQRYDLSKEEAKPFTPPSNWQFSPSRKQYRDQQGNIYDMNGQPVR